MEYELRYANQNDLEKGLLNVYVEGYRFHQNGRPDIFLNLSEEELKKDLINCFDKFKILVVIINETIVGYLAYDIKEKHSKKMHIDQLIISEKHRNHGLGKILMNKVKEIAVEEKCDRIELDCWMFNENAIAMYEHLGFKRQRIMYEMNL